MMIKFAKGIPSIFMQPVHYFSFIISVKKAHKEERLQLGYSPNMNFLISQPAKLAAYSRDNSAT
jgi:hypothetical protein